MNAIETSMQTNLRALQEALANVDEGKRASESVKDVTIAANASGLTISYSATLNGVTVPVVISMSPELDAPAKIADGVALGNLIGKLAALNVAEMSDKEALAFAKNVFASVAETIQTKGLRTVTVPPGAGSDATAPGAHTIKRTGTDGSGPQPLGSSGDSTAVTSGATLFNLLEILTLIVETGQKLKKAAKDIKATEIEQQAKAYEDQATLTRTMADTAQQMGLTYTIITGCMLGLSAVASVAAGIGTAKLASPGTKASGVAADMANVIMDEKTPVNFDVVTSDAGKASRNFLNRTQPARAADPAEVEMGEMAPGPQRSSRVDEIKDDFANNPKIVAARNAYKAALEKSNPPSTEAEIAKAKDDYVSAVMDVKGRYDAAYVHASKSDSDTKRHEMVVANEFAMKHLKGDTVTVSRNGAEPTQTTILDRRDCMAIQSACTKAHKTDQAGESSWKWTAVATGAPMLGQLANIINQQLQASVSYTAQGESASAQEKQAEASRDDKGYDMTKQLEDSAQSVIDAARQTMAKAYESEREAVREIFG